MKVVLGTNCKRLGRSLADELKCGVVEPEMRRFPDGDLYVRCAEELDKETAVILQTPFTDPMIVEHRLVQDAVSNAGAERVISIAPYMSYSRQDKPFKRGESASAFPVLDWLASGCDELVLVDAHNPDIIGEGGKIHNLVPAHSLARRLGGITDVVLAPDKGAFERAEMVAKILGKPCEHIRKTRIDAHTVKMDAGNLDVAGLRVAIVDDIISTGGTMLKAAQQLKKMGALKVYGLASHGMFSKTDLSRLQEGLDIVAVSGSLDTPVSTVDLSQELSNIVKELD